MLLIAEEIAKDPEWTTVVLAIGLVLAIGFVASVCSR